MLTDVAFRVGQTLAGVVTLPASAPSPLASQPKLTAFAGWLARLFYLPTLLVSELKQIRRRQAVDRQLSGLSDTILNDLGVNRHQLPNHMLSRSMASLDELRLHDFR